MNFLLDLLDTVATIVLAHEEGSWNRRIALASDIDPFLQLLEDKGGPYGLEHCGESLFCLDQAVLGYEVRPLITPARYSLVDGALDEMAMHGAAITDITRPHEGVIAFSGSYQNGRLDGRIVPARGWVFLISTNESSESRLLALLDSTIAAFEA